MAQPVPQLTTPSSRWRLVLDRQSSATNGPPLSPCRCNIRIRIKILYYWIEIIPRDILPHSTNTILYIDCLHSANKIEAWWLHSDETICGVYEVRILLVNIHSGSLTNTDTRLYTSVHADLAGVCAPFLVASAEHAGGDLAVVVVGSVAHGVADDGDVRFLQNVCKVT